MKLVLNAKDQKYLGEMKVRLEKSGIPVFVGSDSSYKLKSNLTLGQRSLWIYIDEQYDDALELIKNPEHKTTCPVDTEEFFRAAELEQKNNMTKFLKHLIKVLFLVIVIVFFMLGVVLWLKT